jgi:hypothetical protein
MTLNIERIYVDCGVLYIYALCLYAECHWAECRGARENLKMFVPSFQLKVRLCFCCEVNTAPIQIRTSKVEHEVQTLSWGYTIKLFKAFIITQY